MKHLKIISLILMICAVSIGRADNLVIEGTPIKLKTGFLSNASSTPTICLSDLFDPVTQTSQYFVTITIGSTMDYYTFRSACAVFDFTNGTKLETCSDGNVKNNSIQVGHTTIYQSSLNYPISEVDAVRLTVTPLSSISVDSRQNFKFKDKHAKKIMEAFAADLKQHNGAAVSNIITSLKALYNEIKGQKTGTEEVLVKHKGKVSAATALDDKQELIDKSLQNYWKDINASMTASDWNQPVSIADKIEIYKAYAKVLDAVRKRHYDENHMMSDNITAAEKIFKAKTIAEVDKAMLSVFPTLKK